MRRRLAVVSVLTLLAAACSIGEVAAPVVSTAAPTTQAPVPTTVSAVPDREGIGRLVIVDATGNVALVDPDGENLEPVTVDADASAAYFQPTWSPDATALAFSSAGSDESHVVIHEIADGRTSRVTTVFPAFYFSWSRAGDRVAYLGNAPDGAGLQLAVVDRSAAPLRTDRGQPYYFSWGPAGSMVVHVGVDRLETVDADGTQLDRALAAPGVFRAPQWLERGILYLERADEKGRLVLDAADGATVLAEVDGGASFVASPDGTRVALQAVGDEPEGELAGYGRLVVAQPVPTPPANRLVVLDIDTLEWARVGDEPALAYSWSPTGERLLVLTVADPAVPELAWRVWEDGALGDATTFVPSPTLVRDVLPFFDQYAQSLSFWSPDGSAFTFPGAVDGEQGIFVVDVDRNDIPAKVADGSWVSWSPR